MMKFIFAILLGLATPKTDTGGTYTTNSTCENGCTDPECACNPDEPGPIGDIGQVPPKK